MNFIQLWKGEVILVPKSDASMRSSDVYNKKKQSPLSNINNQEMSNSKN